MACRSNSVFLHVPKFYLKYCVQNYEDSVIHSPWFIFLVLYRTSLAPRIRTFLLKFSDFFLFLLDLKESCKIWWKKSSAWKGGKNTTIYDLSQQIYSTQGKKRNHLIGSRCWHLVIEDGRSSLEPLQLQRGIDGVRIPDWSPLQPRERQQKLYGIRNEISLPVQWRGS